MSDPLVLVDDPRPKVRRLTLNDPDRRNCLSHPLRTQLFDAVHAADADPDVSAIVIAANGPHFCAGYDLRPDRSVPTPFYTSGGEGWWPRHVTDGWMTFWDMSIPIIAQIHGACLAGGTEMVACCDLAYAADDARIGYPPIRTMGSPDMVWFPWYMGIRKAAAMMLTGDSLTAPEAVEAGFLNDTFEPERLEDGVLEMAERVALMPRDLLQLNKRTLHRTMDTMGIRTAIRQGTEITALALHTETSKKVLGELRATGDVTGLFSTRDTPYGEYDAATDAEPGSD